MKKILILVFISIFLIYLQAFAQNYIHVKSSPDVDRLVKMTREISLLLSDCLISGINLNDDYIYSGKHKKLKNDQRKCACANREEAEKILKGLNIILSRHSEWKGKVLFVSEADVSPKNPPVQVSVKNLQDNKKMIDSCLR